MKKLLISLICLCLVATTFVGCGSPTKKRKKNILKELENDRVDVEYMTILSPSAAESEYQGNYLIDDGNYLFNTSEYIYTRKYVGSDEILYDIVRTRIDGSDSSEYVCSVPRDDDFQGLIMVSPDYYFRYKVVGVYSDPAHALLGWPTSYEYQWYRFTPGGDYEYTGFKHETRDEYYGVEEEFNEMVENFHSNCILSHLAKRSDSFINADGIMSSLSDSASENDHDKFNFVEICGYNYETKSALILCNYYISEGMQLIGNHPKYALDIIFLYDGNTGETHYVGLRNEIYTKNTLRIVPMN